MSNNIYEAPEADLKQSSPDQKQSAEDPGDDKLRGLRGWLILVGIGVVLSPFRILIQTVPIYYPLVAEGTLAQILGSGSTQYPPFFGPFLIFEILFNLAMVFAWIYACYLFFSKHYLFPKIYIGLVAISIFFITADAWVYTLLVPGEVMFDDETAKELGRVVISALIWIPYMLVSKRVKATFVEHRPE